MRRSKLWIIVEREMRRSTKNWLKNSGKSKSCTLDLMQYDKEDRGFGWDNCKTEGIEQPLEGLKQITDRKCLQEEQWDPQLKENQTIRRNLQQ